VNTPRELLGILEDFAQKVAEHQVDRAEAVAGIRDVVRAKYPDLLAKLAEGWADTELDRRVKRYIGRRNKTDGAAMARKLAAQGLEQPDLEGNVVHDWFAAFADAETTTLEDHGVYVSSNLASAWRLVDSFEFREEEFELYFAASGNNANATRSQAIEALKRMPEPERRNLRAVIRARLMTQRRAAFDRRYGVSGQAAEG
jgi:hypothetical protein